MSGEKEFKVEDLWKQVEESLEEYKKKLQLQIAAPDKVNEILTLKESDIRQLDKNTRISYAYLLMQHSLYIQQEYNAHMAKYKWSEHNLNVCIGKLSKNFSHYTKWEEKKASVITENSYAKILSDFIRETSLYIETLNSISKKIETMSFLLRQIENER